MDQLLASIAVFIDHLITVGYNVSYTIHPVNCMDVSRGKMILWTIQDMAAWKHLQQKGLLITSGRHVYKYHRHAYYWMAEQIRLRLSPPHYRFPSASYLHYGMLVLEDVIIINIAKPFRYNPFFSFNNFKVAKILC